MTSPRPQPDRYARQVQYAPIGEHGQRLISKAAVAVLGCGALGSVAAEILTRAGVGRLRLIDRDVVEWSNLQRQSLFDESDADAGVAKALAAAERLHLINSRVTLEPLVCDLTPDNIDASLGEIDLVIDASDNFAIRFLLNDWSLATRTPWVHGGAVGAVGQVLLLSGQGDSCFRCWVRDPPPPDAIETCDTAGVLGSATHAIASLQATEAIKWITGNRQAVRKRLLSFDFWNNRIRELTIHRSPALRCPACDDGKFEFLDGTRGGFDDALVLCGRDAVQLRGGGRTIDLAQMAARWEGLGRVQTTPFFVRIHLDGESLTLFRDGRAVINGTTDIGRARIVHDRYVGG